MNVDDKIRVLAHAFEDRAILNRVAFLVRQIIEERTEQGRFINDNQKPYNPVYANRRLVRGLQTHAVNLEFSAAMFGSFDHNLNIKDLEIELGFNRLEMAKLASYHDTYGAGRGKVVREFLGLTEPEQKEVADYILQEFGRKIDFTLNKSLP